MGLELSSVPFFGSNPELRVRWFAIKFRSPIGEKVAHFVIAHTRQIGRSQIGHQNPLFAADALIQNFPRRVDNDSIARKVKAFQIVAGLVAGHNKNAVVISSGGEVPHPGVMLYGRSAAWRGVRYKNDIDTV